MRSGALLTVMAKMQSNAGAEWVWSHTNKSTRAERGANPIGR